MSADAAESKSTPSDEKASSSSGGGSKIVLILTAVNVIVTAAIVAILFVSFQRDRKQPSVTDIAADAGGDHGAPAAGADGHGGDKAAGGEHGAKADAHGGAGGAKGADYGKMVTLEQFTVNLSTPGATSPKFVRVNISIEVPTSDAEAEITSKMPQVRNVIIDLFNAKKISDLATAEGRDYLKEEIKNSLNAFLVSGKVRGVFFTNFTLST